MAKKTPLIENNILEVRDPESERLIYSFDISNPAKWKYWQAFLENEKSFRYVWTDSQGGKFSFSGIKEKRTHQYGEFYIWIAHKRVNNKLHRVYLGANRNLTVQKLQESAQKLNQETSS